MIKKLRSRWNRFQNRKASARYEFDQKMLATLAEDERDQYFKVAMGSEIATASFLEMRRFEALMEVRSGMRMEDRP